MTNQPTVGFIGLGKMGGPVAGHIQRAGYRLRIYDVRAEAAAPFVAAGAETAASPAEVAAGADVIFTALPTPLDVEAVALGPQGVIEGVRPDAVFVDISTSHPDLIRALEPRFRGRDAWVLDAPVSAGQPGAAPGIHEVLVGGPPAVVERVRPIFAAYGDQIIYTGPLGSASTCKLIHQLIGAGVAQAIAEGLSLGVKAGLDVRVVWDAVRRGLIGRMQVLHEQVPRSVFPGTYEPATFSLTLLRKDVGLATALGRQLEVPLPVTNLVEQFLVEALGHGWGNGAGYAIPCRLQEERAGVDLRAPGVDTEAAARYLSSHPEHTAFDASSG
ncbi:MAG TPA: NAD(P)-dependent oxidoreductase [Chloroflexota bacterium]|jgi:3-hydroxyisobutyrate dehydrogenase